MNVDIVDPRGFLGRIRLVQRQTPITDRDLLRLETKLAGSNDSCIPVVGSFDEQGVRAGSGSITDRNGHVVRPVGQLELPVLKLVKVDQRIQPEIGVDLVLALHRCGRMTSRRTAHCLDRRKVRRNRPDIDWGWPRPVVWKLTRNVSAESGRRSSSSSNRSGAADLSQSFLARSSCMALCGSRRVELPPDGCVGPQ